MVNHYMQVLGLLGSYAERWTRIRIAGSLTYLLFPRHLEYIWNVQAG